MVKSVINEDEMPLASPFVDPLFLPSGEETLLQPELLQSKSPKRLAVVGKGMRRNNLLLSKVLRADLQRWYPWSALQQRFNVGVETPDAFIGWGHKKSYHRAKNAAKSQKLPTLSIEDGFLRSLDSGLSSRYGLSVVIDDIGIYFDLTQRSRL